MEAKIILPWALLGGAVGFAATPISKKVVGIALVKKIVKKGSEFTKTLNTKQTVIYARIKKRSSDLDKFGKSTNEYSNIKQELYSLKDELSSTLSPKQTTIFQEIEYLQNNLSRNEGYASKGTVALGALIGLIVANLNK